MTTVKTMRSLLKKVITDFEVVKETAEMHRRLTELDLEGLEVLGEIGVLEYVVPMHLRGENVDPHFKMDCSRWSPSIVSCTMALKDIGLHDFAALAKSFSTYIGKAPEITTYGRGANSVPDLIAKWSFSYPDGGKDQKTIVVKIQSIKPTECKIDPSNPGRDWITSVPAELHPECKSVLDSLVDECEDLVERSDPVAVEAFLAEAESNA